MNVIGISRYISYRGTVYFFGEKTQNFYIYIINEVIIQTQICFFFPELKQQAALRG